MGKQDSGMVDSYRAIACQVRPEMSWIQCQNQAWSSFKNCIHKASGVRLHYFVSSSLFIVYFVYAFTIYNQISKFLVN